VAHSCCDVADAAAAIVRAPPLNEEKDIPETINQLNTIEIVHK
jgi:hypothetical protein